MHIYALNTENLHQVRGFSKIQVCRQPKSIKLYPHLSSRISILLVLKSPFSVNLYSLVQINRTKVRNPNRSKDVICIFQYKKSRISNILNRQNSNFFGSSIIFPLSLDLTRENSRQFQSLAILKISLFITLQSTVRQSHPLDKKKMLSRKKSKNFRVPLLGILKRGECTKQ